MCPFGSARIRRGDPYGLSAGVPSGNGPNSPPPTGPNESGAPDAPTQVPDGSPTSGYRLGLLHPYFGTPSIFKCPVEPAWQCGYGMNYSTGQSDGAPGSCREPPLRSAHCVGSPAQPWLARSTAGCKSAATALGPV